MQQDFQNQIQNFDFDYRKELLVNLSKRPRHTDQTNTCSEPIYSHNNLHKRNLNFFLYFIYYKFKEIPTLSVDPI